MTMGQLPARRLMDLFAVYEALPHHREFVDLTVYPMMQAEIISILGSWASIQYRGHFKFVDAANQMWSRAQCERRFTVVQDCRVFYVNADQCINVEFTVMHSQHTRVFKIPLRPRCEAELERDYHLAHERLLQQTAAVKRLQ